LSAARDALRAAVVAGIRVAVDGKDLVWEAASEPPAALLKALARHKAEIIGLLDPAARMEGAPSSAAFAGHDGGIPDAWAAALAKLSRQRCPPDDVSYRQWGQLRDGFVRFCGRWAGPAEALGWRPRDLLGWDPRYPYTPIAKRLGLAWKFEGAAVVEVQRDAIVIERRHGLRTTLPRLWTI
jgi:hypothetical protein